MRAATKPLHLNREVVRELTAKELDSAAGGRISIPPTFCQCTGTETYTNICCIQTG
jgi:hypothetical protein